MSELLDDLKQLAEMRDAGDITQAEYKTIKVELLAEAGVSEPESDETTSPPEESTESAKAGWKSIWTDGADLSRGQGALFIIGILVVAFLLVQVFAGDGDGEADGSSEALLEVTVFDWTETNPPIDALVVAGEDTWTPDLEFGGDSHGFRPFPVGESHTFTIYPDGRSANAIDVSFVMTEEMVPISGSARALTNVEIYDDTVIVSGMAIPGFERTYSR